MATFHENLVQSFTNFKNKYITPIQTALNNKQDKLTNPLTQSDVVDNLTSTSTTAPLSANQGRIISQDVTKKVNLDGGNFITGEQRLVDSREKSAISTNNYGDAYISFKDKNFGDIGAIVPQKGGGNNFALALISFDNLIVQNSLVLREDNVINRLTSTSSVGPLSAYQGYIMSRDIPWYGTSSTAESTTAKVATTADSKFALTTGAKVSIKFTYSNTASAPTLNVDSTGAKSIKAYGTTTPTIWWQAGDIVTFTYDGTNWIMGATEGQVAQINSNLSNVLKGGTYPSCVHQNFLGGSGDSVTYKINGNLGCLLIIQSAGGGSKFISINFLYDSAHIDKISGALADSQYSISAQLTSSGANVTVSSPSIVLTVTILGILL